MVVRTSEGLFLEILEATPAAGVPIEFEVYDGASPATQLALLENASEGAFQPQFCEVGSGSFRLQRSDPKAVHLVKGNYVKCRVGGIPRFGFFIEEPEDVVASTSDAAGELITAAGGGALAYLERAQVYPAIWPAAAVAIGAATAADNGAGSTSLVGTRPTGTVAGDVLIATVTWVGGDTKNPTAPPGWKLIHKATNGSALGVAVYVRRALAGEPASWTWHFTSSVAATVEVIRLLNASGDDTVYGVSDTTGSGVAIKSPSIGVDVVDGVLLTIAATAANTSVTPPGGQTEAVDRGATGRTAELAYKVGPALGDSGDLISTAALTGNWIGLSLFVPSNASSERVFSGATFGAILATLIDEAQARGGLPALAYDFGADLDSQSQPWTDTHELAFHIGTSLLDVWRQLVALGLEGLMTPELGLRAFVEYARHFETTVILRKGKHFAGDVVTKGHDSGLRTRFLVEGAGGRVVEVADPGIETDVRIGRREGYLAMRTSDDATELQRAGDGSLELARLDSEAIELAVHHGLAAAGDYEPFVDYREGDWISLEPAGDGVVEAHRVVGYRIRQVGLDYGVDLNLNSVALDREIRLRRALDALSGSGVITAGGGAFGLGGVASSSGAGSGLVAAVAGDEPGFLSPKLVAGAGITKAVEDAGGSKRVRLSIDPAVGQLKAEKGVANGYAALDSGILVPFAQMGTGVATGTKFLRDDRVWAVPAGGGGSSVADGKPLIYTPPAVAHAKDDEFADGAGQSGPTNGLNAKWSKRNLGTSTWLRLDDTYAPGALLFDIPTGQAADQWIYQAVPAGNFIAFCRFALLRASDRQMWGLAILDTNGTGIGIREDTQGSSLIMEITTWAQTATSSNLDINLQTPLNESLPLNLWVQYAGGTAPASVNAANHAADRGLFLAVSVNNRTRNFTPAYIAFGRSFGTGVSKVVLDSFRIV